MYLAGLAFYTIYITNKLYRLGYCPVLLLDHYNRPIKKNRKLCFSLNINQVNFSKLNNLKKFTTHFGKNIFKNKKISRNLKFYFTQHQYLKIVLWDKEKLLENIFKNSINLTHQLSKFSDYSSWSNFT